MHDQQPEQTLASPPNSNPQTSRIHHPRAEQGGHVEHVLIIGGGITGMTAALQAAKAGYRATIVEQGAELGGVMGKMKARIPDSSPYADPRDTGIAAMKADIAVSDKITVYLNSNVSKTSGAPGFFVADIIDQAGGMITENFGAIVRATGAKPYDANTLTEFDYSENENVVTQRELEALVTAAGGGAIKRPSDGKDVANVLFIQCAGQRSDKAGHLSHCSGFCCSASVKQAMYFKDQNLDIDTTILYTDLRLFGSQGEEFYRSAQKKGVIFSMGVAESVRRKENTSGGPIVNFKDLILDESLQAKFDLVVLATGMQASSEFNSESVASPNDFEVGNGGQNTGVYLAGSVRSPMDAKQAIEEGAAAAMRAIHAIKTAAEGDVGTGPTAKLEDESMSLQTSSDE